MKKKREVVNKQKYEEAAKLRNEEVKIIEELEKAMAEWNEKLDKKITTVDVDIISNVVSMMSGIPVSKISTQETKRLVNMEKELMGKIIGQDVAVTKVVKAIKRSRIGLKDKNKPSVFLLLGKTGTGKTLLAKVLAEYIYGDEDSLVRIDMSEYMEKHAITRLIGAPPSYVGYEEGGQLTEKIRRKPYCVILFDEIEKAHDDVFNLLLQLLDEGHLTDGMGRKVNFKNTLIILTSNIGANEVKSFGKSMGFETDSTSLTEETKSLELIKKALKKKFKPEFLNRINDTIIFNNLVEEDINKIVYLELEKLKKRIQEMSYKLNVSKEVVDFIAKEGYDEEYGARPLGRAIQHYIEDPVADEILNGNVKEGDTLYITFDKDKEEISIKNTKPSKK